MQLIIKLSNGINNAAGSVTKMLSTCWRCSCRENRQGSLACFENEPRGSKSKTKKSRSTNSEIKSVINQLLTQYKKKEDDFKSFQQEHKIQVVSR